ncbi:TetR family transcriptional regulator, partial [Mycobacterium sp. ITM-2017-0098]
DPGKPERSQPVIDRAAAAFARWQDVIARRLTADGVAEQDAAALAMLVLASFEGAIVVARASRDVTPLDLVQAQLRSLISPQITPAARKRATR